MSSIDSSLTCGSRWNRWDPHLHAPGTVLNDQYGKGALDEFLGRLESASPALRAIGITDYCLTDLYERVREEKANGRLGGIEMVFPNVELRLDIGTSAGRWVNLHLLVCPDEADHITQLHRFLSRLTFRAYDDKFACSRDDLIRLGRAASNGVAMDDGAALRHGVTQFKVNLDALRHEYENSAWAQRNILIAVAGGQTDGTSGVRDASDNTLRQEIESLASIIFASSDAQREFWLGKKAVGPDALKARYRGLKPCLHGSDSHSLEKVAAPDLSRYSWIKGAVNFDALRQACIDPERAFVGAEPPPVGSPSQLIDQIEVRDASWMATPLIPLNPGLVAVIGARGSGKTALADIIARGCDASSVVAGSNYTPQASFLYRARELLDSESVRVTWKSGVSVDRRLDGSDEPSVSFQRVRYLSQQFVEELCSATELADELLREIERVVFEAHPVEERDGCLNFADLLHSRASRFRDARLREEATIVELSDRIGIELEKDRLRSSLETQVAQKQAQIAAYEADRSKLVAADSEQRVAQLKGLTDACEKVRGYVRFYTQQETALLKLQDEVRSTQASGAEEQLRRLKERFTDAKLSDEQWRNFLVTYSGDVAGTLASALKAAADNLSGWKGKRPAPRGDLTHTLLDDQVDLEKNSLAVLEAEVTRLQQLIGGDVAIQKQFAALTARINSELVALQALAAKLDDASAAKDRVKSLSEERGASYRRVFEAIESEQKVLQDLYAPLAARLKGASGTLGKLSFTVSRNADAEAWARAAEESLLDLRKLGPFKGYGSLEGVAAANLKQVWQEGDAEAVDLAMQSFRKDYQSDLLARSLVPKGDSTGEYRAWLKRFAAWLYSSNHVTINYGIDYDGVDIRKLSPGTRGVVLLLLYLAMDEADDRPLIIDQPEENLDPKSVFDELVGLFVAAKSKRQVIIVTHNANLVVNTDADQVIVAQATHRNRGELPTITYLSGGLEEPQIRQAVCEILEGGEEAFQERARRLRVKLP